MTDSKIRVLLVEDAPDGQVLTRALLAEAADFQAEVHWVSSCADGLLALQQTGFDVILLHDQIGAETGLHFLGKMPLDVTTPVILLTGQPGQEAALAAMRAGAADYLATDDMTSTLLARSVRYAVEQHRVLDAQRRAEKFRDGQTTVLEMVVRGLPLNEVLTELVRAAEAQNDFRCAILVTDESGKYLRMEAAPSLPSEFVRQARRLRIAPTSGCGSAALRREVVTVESVATSPLWSRFQEVATGAGIAASYSHPILSSAGEAIGIVSVLFRRERLPTASEVALIENVTQIAAIAIERTRAVEALRLAKEQQDAILNHIPSAVWLKGRDGRYLKVNHVASAVLGIEPEQLVGKTDLDLLPPELAKRFMVEDHRAMTDGSLQAGELEIPTADGVRIWEVTKVAYRDATGEVAGTAGIAHDVTESRHTEEALRASEARYRALTENIRQVFWLMDPAAGRVVYVSPAYEEIWGRPREEVCQRPRAWAEALHPDDRERILAGAAVDDISDYEREYRIVRPDGKVRWILDRGFRVEDEQGRLIWLAGTAEDVTERKRADQALRESEEKFRQLADHVDQVFWIFNPDFTQTLYVSSAFEEVWGLPVQDVYDRPRAFIAPVHPDDVTRLTTSMLRIKDGFNEPCEYRILRPDGQERWIRSRGSPVRDGSGRVQRVVGTSQDITQIVQARLELERSETHYRRLVRTAPQGIYGLDLEGRFTEVNPAVEMLLGRPAAELIGKPFAAVIAPEDLPRVSKLRQQALAAGEEMEIELEIVRPSGERRLASIHSAAVREGDRITGTHGIGRDITEERARENQMRLLSSALDGLEQGVSVTELDTGATVYRNAAWLRLFGCGPGDEGGYALEDFVPDEAAREQLREIQAALREEGQWSGRVWRRRMDDQRVIVLDVVIGTAEGEHGQTLVLAVYHDAAEELNREQRLRRAERLASLGTLIGGVAHELNNPLHAIRNFADLMLLEPRNPNDQEALEIMQREADRASRVVSDLRVFARQTQEEQNGERADVDLNEIVRHVLKVRRYTLHTNNIVVQEDLSEHLPKVLANRSEIEQVLLNLVVNAEQALLAGPSDRRLITLRTRASRAGAVVSVIDNGPGIRPEHLDLVFDPFFTTKSPGHGTGLGLSLVHSIVKDHGGDVRVESEPGHGATFVVELPRASPVTEADSSEGAWPTGLPVRPLRILVVDDESTVRLVTKRFLSRRGHHVDLAEEGQEALNLLAMGEYDAILSDLRMPGLDGEGLLQHLRTQGDGLHEKLILLTGDATRAGVDLGVPVLTKPIKVEEVARIIEHRAGRTEPNPS